MVMICCCVWLSVGWCGSVGFGMFVFVGYFVFCLFVIVGDFLWLFGWNCW